MKQMIYWFIGGICLWRFGCTWEVAKHSGSIHFLDGALGQRNPCEHECKISQPSLYIFC